MITPLSRRIQKVISLGRPASRTISENAAAFAAVGSIGRGTGQSERTVGFAGNLHKPNEGEIPAVPEQKTPSRILLLQGPVGPFFSELHAALSDAGLKTRRVILNAGDKIFSGAKECIYFTGTQSEWETWLRFEIALLRPAVIILFGCERPAHVVALRLARLYGIDVLCLEEGYLRTGYVTCEVGGNNRHSPLTNWDAKCPPSGSKPNGSAPVPFSTSFATMGLWTSIYYLAREVASKQSDRHLFHRQHEPIVSLTWRWGVHLLRRLAARASELPIRQAIYRKRGYILVPLQVSSDSQIQFGARGWSTSRLIDTCLKASSAHRVDQMVVFKLHPLEPESAELKREIFRQADLFGVDRQRIAVLHSGRMGDLAKHSSGMVVINSTSVFSAFHHNVPVLVLGESVFRHSEIVTLAETEADVAAFFKVRHAKPKVQIDAFIAAIKAQSLLRGDFYVLRGRKIAIEGIVHKVQRRHVKATSGVEARV
jgi:capsular polysaccharide export protein